LTPVIWLAVALGLSAGLYLVLLGALVAVGRRAHARAFSRFLPDCVVLFGRLFRDPRLARRHKVLVGGLIAYLATPFDLVPDFVPVVGQLDDAIIAALVLRRILRAAGTPLLAEHWPGPPETLALLTRLVA
jgi:uncharacterized membrane protein YkvA (DUF1232 family)